MRLAAMNVPTAILLGAVIIAGGIIGARFVPRYEVRMVAGAGTFWRLNVATGEVEVCAFERDASEAAGRKRFQCHADLS